MLVAITVVLAALAVLAAIVVVAVGGGGELSTEHPDHPPLALPGRRPIGGTDAVLLRLPLGLWGYHKQITDEALERFAYELTERDTRIAVLEQQLAEARQGPGGDPRGRPALPPARTDMPVMGEDPLSTRADRPAGPPATGEDPLPIPVDGPHGPPAEGGDPLATRTDQASGAPVTREEPLGPPGAVADDPVSRWTYTPAPDPWKTFADDPAEAEDTAGHEDPHPAGDEAGDAEDRRSARKDDAE